MVKDDTNTGAVAEQFRLVTGLPKRTSDKPHDVSKPSELRRQAEPKGGLGGRGEPEGDDRSGDVDPEVVEALSKGEELSAKSGQGASSPEDASTSTDATEAEAAAATKAPAKKTATK